jgi:hypothetical protein
MKKFLLLFISVFICCSLFAQEAGKVGNTDVENINKIGSVPISALGGIGNMAVEVYLPNCMAIKENNPAAADGIYTIDPDGDGSIDPFDCYCDMTTDGGGWTLVLLSNSSVAGCPRPYWTDVVNSVNLNGTLSADITSFDLFLGVRNWNYLGTTARLDMGDSPSSLSHRAYYTFSLNEGNNYALVMSDEVITIHADETTASPGIYTYHNGRPLSARDADHDASGGNCSNTAGYSAWWFGNCWSGSFWGGGGAAFQDAPYWTSDESEYFNYGSIWLR